MVDLEYYSDQINEDDIWYNLKEGITEDELGEFYDKYEAMIYNLKVEVESLECKLMDAIRELEGYIIKEEEEEDDE